MKAQRGKITKRHKRFALALHTKGVSDIVEHRDLIFFTELLKPFEMTRISIDVSGKDSRRLIRDE